MLLLGTLAWGRKKICDNNVSAITGAVKAPINSNFQTNQLIIVAHATAAARRVAVDPDCRASTVVDNVPTTNKKYPTRNPMTWRGEFLKPRTTKDDASKKLEREIIEIIALLSILGPLTAGA